MTQRIIAIDSNRYALRAVATEHTDALHAGIEARTGEIDSVLHFIRRQIAETSDYCIVGSPLDTWPPDLHKRLELLAPIRWLPPELMRMTTSFAARWQKERRLHRARFLARLGRLYAERDGLSPIECVLDWEDFIIDESRNNVRSERRRTGYECTERSW